MTARDVEAEIAQLVVESSEFGGPMSDDETAHRLQDELWVRALRAIADGRCDNAQEVAAAALKVLDLKFSRWYA